MSWTKDSDTGVKQSRKEHEYGVEEGSGVWWSWGKLFLMLKIFSEKNLENMLGRLVRSLSVGNEAVFFLPIMS